MFRPCASERPAAGTKAVMTAAPLRIDRRDTSVGGTRAVVSSQQLMNGSPETNLSPRRQSSTQPKGLERAGTSREFRSNQLYGAAESSFLGVARQKIVLSAFRERAGLRLLQPGHRSGRVAAFSQAPVFSSTNGM